MTDLIPRRYEWRIFPDGEWQSIELLGDQFSPDAPRDEIPAPSADGWSTYGPDDIWGPIWLAQEWIGRLAEAYYAARQYTVREV